MKEIIVPEKAPEPEEVLKIFVPLAAREYFTARGGIVPTIAADPATGQQIPIGWGLLNAYSEVRNPSGVVVGVVKHGKIEFLQTGVMWEVTVPPAWWTNRDAMAQGA